MLPKINAEQGGQAKQRVLVGGRHSLELLRGGVVREPGPAGALNAESGGVDSLFEVVERAKV